MELPHVHRLRRSRREIRRGFGGRWPGKRLQASLASALRDVYSDSSSLGVVKAPGRGHVVVFCHPPRLLVQCALEAIRRHDVQ
jgi:hypothetical protein